MTFLQALVSTLHCSAVFAGAGYLRLPLRLRQCGLLATSLEVAPTIPSRLVSKNPFVFAILKLCRRFLNLHNSISVRFCDFRALSAIFFKNERIFVRTPHFGTEYLFKIVNEYSSVLPNAVHVSQRPSSDKMSY